MVLRVLVLVILIGVVLKVLMVVVLIVVVVVDVQLVLRLLLVLLRTCASPDDEVNGHHDNYYSPDHDRVAENECSACVCEFETPVSKIVSIHGQSTQQLIKCDKTYNPLLIKNSTQINHPTYLWILPNNVLFGGVCPCFLAPFLTTARKTPQSTMINIKIMVNRPRI